MKESSENKAERVIMVAYQITETSNLTEYKALYFNRE